MSIKTTSTMLLTAALTLALAGPLMIVSPDSEARRGGGHRGGMHTRTNVHSTRNVNRNVNRNTNVNVNRHIDVDVDVNRRGWGRGYRHPVATGVAIGATAAVIGSVVRTLPPSCTTVITDNITYQQCGNTYYQPRYSGSSITYVVVKSPY
jgi:hypothetical protein